MERLLLPLAYLVHSVLYGHFHSLSAHLRTLLMTPHPAHIKACLATNWDSWQSTCHKCATHIRELVTARCQDTSLTTGTSVPHDLSHNNAAEKREADEERNLSKNKITQSLGGLTFLLTVKHHWFAVNPQQRGYCSIYATAERSALETLPCLSLQEKGPVKDGQPASQLVTASSCQGEQRSESPHAS